MERYRLDYLVAKKLGVSRSSAVNLIESDKVSMNGRIANKPSLKVSEDTLLEIETSPKTKVADLKLEVVYEDEDCVVINKPAGILSHSKGAFSEESTVASWLKLKTRGFEETNNRAGIVHRLDRSTSGIMICAKTPEALAYLQKQFSMRRTVKKYIALIEGAMEPPEAIIDIPIERNPKDPKRFRASANGKSAQTMYKVIRSFRFQGRKFNLLELTPKTGRTHQLRVHLAHMKKPIAGDDFYSGIRAKRLYLHALSLEVTIPDGERKIFQSDLPPDFLKPKILDYE